MTRVWFSVTNGSSFEPGSWMNVRSQRLARWLSRHPRYAYWLFVIVKRRRP